MPHELPRFPDTRLPRTGGHPVKKFATYALIAFVIWWTVQNPTAAAHLVHDISGFFSHAANSASTIANSNS